MKIICGFPAGTSLDIVARIFAQKLEEALSQPFVVENRVGASGNIGAAEAARAAPDGYTLGVGGIAQAIGMSLFKNLNFDLVKNFEPVAYMNTSPNVLVVNSSLGVNSVQELVALAKKDSGQLTYGTAGVGTAPHMSGELFAQIAGIKLAHVPYRGTNRLDLIGGRLSLMFAPAPTAAPHVKDSHLKFLAVTSSKPTSLLPGILPLADSPGFAGFESSIWQGMWAPKGTPKPIIARIHAVMNKAAGTPRNCGSTRRERRRAGDLVIGGVWRVRSERSDQSGPKVVKAGGIKIQ